MKYVIDAEIKGEIRKIKVEAREPILAEKAVKAMDERALILNLRPFEIGFAAAA